MSVQVHFATIDARDCRGARGRPDDCYLFGRTDWNLGHCAVQRRPHPVRVLEQYVSDSMRGCLVQDIEDDRRRAEEIRRRRLPAERL